MTDEHLLAAAQNGDRAALEALLSVHRQGVFRYGLRVCPTTEDAEDAVQHTLWSAARYIGAFRRTSAFSTWLFAIVRNQCLRILGRDRFYADLDEVIPSLADPTPLADHEIARREVQTALAGALVRLDPIHREVLLLRDVQGLSAPEAASVLGIGIAALKSRLHRARAELREVLHADGPSLLVAVV
jgi:RNA polymerase sigma-70 factor, ECF subfamily